MLFLYDARIVCSVGRVQDSMTLPPLAVAALQQFEQNISSALASNDVRVRP